MDSNKLIWVFSGEKRFPAALFSTREKAEEWISHNKCSGILTCYPLDISAYDWAIKNNFFTPKKAHESSPKFIQNFSSASQEHYHYLDGKPD